MSANPWSDETFREPDPRFPSGRWAGFWSQDGRRGRMSLDLTFANGKLFGDGRDRVGDFVLSGQYDTRTGACSIHKAYLGQHGVEYEGCATSQGIRGDWRIHIPRVMLETGPFHIWPVSSSGDAELSAALALPAPQSI